MILLLTIICCSSSQAQEKTFCRWDGTLSNHSVHLPSPNNKQEMLDNKKGTNNDVIYIQTVVHILYNTPQQDVDDDEIITLLEDLNKVYRKEIDIDLVLPEHQSTAADSRIQFCLAKTDPNGNTTTGINHIQTDIEAFSSEITEHEQIKTDSLGGASHWNTNEYLNIWIGPIGGSGEITSWGIPQSGYMPLGAVLDTLYDFELTPGVILDWDVFNLPPPFSAVGTLSHEAGHALGLLHTHGDAPNPSLSCDYDDGIADTPLCGFDPSITNCGASNINTCIEPVNDQADMISNIMNYSCAMMISAQQADRIYENVTTLGSTGVLIDGPCGETPQISSNFNALSSKSICNGGEVDFDFTGVGATSWQWTFEGGTPATSDEENPVITYIESGVYDVELTVSDGTDESTTTEANFVTVLPQPTATITQNTPASSSSANDGSIQVEVFDGQGPYTFELLPGNITNMTGFFDGLAVGDYTISIYNDETQCSVEIPVSVDVSTNTIEVQQFLSDINIAPNPNNGHFQITFNQAFSEEVKLTLLDVMGREVKADIAKANNPYHKEWTLSDYASSIYFLKIKRNEVTAAKKVIIW